jgi:hypothetical protein
MQRVFTRDMMIRILMLFLLRLLHSSLHHRSSRALCILFLVSYIIHIVGRKYSILAPKWYAIIFVICDLISLILQGIGGRQAAVAVRTNRDTTDGTHTMVAVISFQMLSMSIYVLLVVNYIFRVSKANVSMKWT